MQNNIDEEKIMFVTQDRVFYLGLVGRRMRARRMGAASLYVAPEGGFQLKVGNQPWEDRALALLPPYCPHQVMSSCGKIINILIEPEHVSAGALSKVMERLNRPGEHNDLVTRIRQAPHRLRAVPDAESLSPQRFDHLVMGYSIDGRVLDPRIEAALDDFITEAWRNELSAAEYARGIGLSASRFLHLFKEETGTSFRNHRMWKRARAFLYHANRTGSLTDLAFDLGYPDSSHFSHSIRKTFGLKPRSIRLGSRDLKIVSASTSVSSCPAW
ncbi:AraC family transcriptional regulator [Alcanivorax balearicus MACL04]|uniref:AraC family transcriptional regulator n=1 Tax=Alloalcanivorax balearicus MACL04 TaxID=1177182 RepID=A0ABT2QXU3_9GAMM|nr:AraC family transcriptional regulator [Alloalcanivorax balearicus]MCU5782322.1 AraC family transcriptional regulator [Alloalcanivorax balearicus MACL04]